MKKEKKRLEKLQKKKRKLKEKETKEKQKEESDEAEAGETVKVETVFVGWKLPQQEGATPISLHELCTEVLPNRVLERLMSFFTQTNK